MHMIAYTSRFKNNSDITSVLEDITRVAKLENAKRSITGVLFYLDGQFLQIIEGDEAVLRQLMANIEKDDRHEDVDYLIDCEVTHRGFSDWNMDYFHLKNEMKFDSGTLMDLTKRFETTLLPRADSLVFYYKALMEEKERVA